MLKRIEKFLLLVFFLPTFLASADEITLLTALEQKKIQVTASGTGSYQGLGIQLVIRNLGTDQLEVNIPAGLVFNSINESEQDLIVTKEALLVVLPKKNGQTAIYTMCIQASNSSPGKGSGFRPDRMAEAGLLKLVQHIAKHNYQNSTAQSAVWAVANGRPMSDIYSSDPAMTKELCSLVNEATGRPCTQSNYVARRHSITSVRTSLEVLLPERAGNAVLGLYDQSGQAIYVYFAGQSLPPGFHQFKPGIFHTLGDSAKVYLRLHDGGKLLAERLATVRDTILRLQTLPETKVSYDLPKEVTARAGIYDEADQLYVLLQDSIKLTKGFHQSDFRKAIGVPFGKKYFFKVKAGGQTLAQQEILLNQLDKEKFAPLTKRGTFTFRLAEAVKDGKIAVYDPAGAIVWVVYEQVSMSPGTKQVAYVFQHRQGRGAEFWLRITSPDGKVLAEQMVKQL